MKLGFRSESVGAGIVASLISFVGIGVAKLIIVLTMIGLLFLEAMGEPPVQRAGLIAYRAIEIQRQASGDDSVTWETALEQAEATVSEMTSEDIENEIIENMEDFAAALDNNQQAAEYVVEAGLDLDALGAGTIAAFLSAFGLIDIIFVLLAVGTAFKVASG